jgi:hypothetical protein
LSILIFDNRQASLLKDLSKSAAIDPSADKLNIGNVISDPKLWNSFVPVPSYALNEIPQLAGTKFLVGQMNIVVARIADTRVVAVVLR